MKQQKKNCEKYNKFKKKKKKKKKKHAFTKFYFFAPNTNTGCLTNCTYMYVTSSCSFKFVLKNKITHYFVQNL